MANILIVEDEKRIQLIVADYLMKTGYQIIIADNGVEALQKLNNHNIDLAILDIMLPDMDGFELCRHIRETSAMPIIFLTAKQEEGEKLKGYRLGCDDYMTKPFSPNVLVAKVRALLRRAGDLDSQAVLFMDGIELHMLSHEVYVDGDRVDLTHKEYELLLLFMRNPKQVFSRERLLSQIWGFDFSGTTRTVDAHIKNLRKKLGDKGEHIRTLIRAGYKFEVMERD